MVMASNRGISFPDGHELQEADAISAFVSIVLKQLGCEQNLSAEEAVGRCMFK